MSLLGAFHGHKDDELSDLMALIYSYDAVMDCFKNEPARVAGKFSFKTKDGFICEVELKKEVVK